MIMEQAKAAVAALGESELADFKIIGITLDAEQDTQERLKAMAQGQQVGAPVFNLCTGELAKVENLLDKLSVARSRDPETGVIDHANLFILVDRQGKIAYRLSLGDRQKQWLISALHLLLAEPGT